MGSNSVLHFTEVKPLRLSGPVVVSPEGVSVMRASRWSAQESAKHKASGHFPWWYEVSVTSSKAEAGFRQNQLLQVGGKAELAEKCLQDANVLRDIYGPALEMVKQMDQVGSSENNNTKWPVLRGLGGM